MTPIHAHDAVESFDGLRKKAVSLFLCLALVLAAGSASALDDPRVHGKVRSRTLLSDMVLGAAGLVDVEDIRGVVPRLLDRVRRLPFRPVRIGEQPRTPRDPETGAGVVVKLRF